MCRPREPDIENKKSPFFFCRAAIGWDRHENQKREGCQNLWRCVVTTTQNPHLSAYPPSAFPNHSVLSSFSG